MNTAVNLFTPKGLAQAKEALSKEEAALEAKLKPLREKRKRILENMRPLQTELRKVDEQLKAARENGSNPTLAEIKDGLAMISRAMGGKSLTVQRDEKPNTAAPAAAPAQAKASAPAAKAESTEKKS
jgi:uncharacterized protein YlxW (UPF0749 family)